RSLFLARSASHRALHSFPTRRSSDLLHRDEAPVRRRRQRFELPAQPIVEGADGEAHRRAAAPGDLTEEDRVARDNVRASLRAEIDRKSTRLNSSHVKISYAVFCLKKK